MIRWTGVAGVAAAGLLIAGCSSSPPITSGAGNTLRADVLALTQAVAAHQWSAADQALAQLRGDLTAAMTADALSAERAQAIRADVAAVAADLAAHRAAVAPSTPSTSSTSSTKPKPAPPPPPPEHGHGHGDHGHGGEGDG